MTLAYVGASSVSTSNTVVDGVTDEGNQRVCIIETTTPSFRMYNLSNQAQFLSNITCLSSPIGVALVNTVSAVIISSSVTTVDFIELSSGFRFNGSGGAAAP